MFEYILVFGLIILILQSIPPILAFGQIRKLRFKEGYCELTNEEDIPEHILSLLEPQGRILEELGYKTFIHVKREDMVLSERSLSWMRCYFNQEHATYAWLSSSELPDPHQPCSINFITRFNDGTQYETLNGLLHSVIITPDYMTVDDHYLDDLREINRRHLEHTEQILNQGPKALSITKDEALAYLRKDIKETLELMEKKGMATKEDGLLKLTIPSALKFSRKVVAGSKKMAKVIKASAREGMTIPVEAEVNAFQRMASFNKKEPMSIQNKLLLLGISALAFTLSFGLKASWEFVLILLGVVLFHELGHLLTMKAFGAKDLKIIFLPFLGAVATGKKEDMTARERWWVLAMGPLPGLVLALFLMETNSPIEDSPILDDICQVLLILNYLNWLPFSPLDGGEMVKVMLFKNAGIARALFSGLGALAFIFGGISIEEPILVALGILLILGVRTSLKDLKLSSSVHSKWNTLDLTDKNDDEIKELRVRTAFEVIKEKLPNKIMFAQKVSLINTWLLDSQSVQMKRAESFFYLTFYLLVLFAPILRTFWL